MERQEGEGRPVRKRHNWLSLMLALMLCACQSFRTEPTPTATDTPMPTDTPVPTDTPTPTLTPTNTYTPTPDRTATAAVRATETTQAIIDEIDSVLRPYGYSTKSGSLGWVQRRSTDITVAQYGAINYSLLDQTKKFSNFALKIDIRWDSQTGLAGCGIIFRAEDDIERGEQMRFYTMRLSGLPAWDVELWEYDDFQANLSGRVHTSGAINLDSGSVNEYLLIADGVTLQIYANDSNIGSVTISSRQTGKIAFFTWQESGVTTCEFDNGWVWILE